MPNRHLIVYAEDDPDDLQFVKDVFEKHDHITILHAPDGWDALELLSQLADIEEYPCLVILDINLPRLNGREVLVRLRQNEKLAHLPVVLFSTSSSPMDKAFAQNWKSELISKPLHFKDLEHIGKVFLDKCNFELSKLKM